MSDAQWAWFQAHTQGFGDQDESGIDLSLLRENLELTPLQRLRRLEQELSLKRLIEEKRD